MLPFSLSKLRQLRLKSKYQLLQGGLEVITPTNASGWVYLPFANLSVVELLIGNHMISQAVVNLPRPDVEACLGIFGDYGFEIPIPDDFPLVEFELEPTVIAHTADGLHRVNLNLFENSKAKLTTHILQAALHPKRRGLHGHFDGLSPSGDLLHGWSFQVGKKPVSVWLHADGLPSKQLMCDQNRPDIVMNGSSVNCGFSISLNSWPEAVGKVVLASFDEKGLLNLPQQKKLQIP